MLPRALPLLLLFGACAPPAQVAPGALPDDGNARGAATGPFTTWHLVVGGARYTLALGSPRGGTLRDDQDNAFAVTDVTWDAARSRLAFRALSSDSCDLYRAAIVDGVLAGRAAIAQPCDDAPADDAFDTHLTGWSEGWFADALPRAYDLAIGDQLATLRLDRGRTDGQVVGQFKVYASATRGSLDEGLSYDLRVHAWDGTTLDFSFDDGVATRRFTGVASGRSIGGTTDEPGGAKRTWSGSRIEVLTHGLTARDLPSLEEWQVSTRRRLRLLALGGDPLLVEGPAVRGAPFAGEAVDGPDDRDDALGGTAGAYTVEEVSFQDLIAVGEGVTIPRDAHGWLTTPSSPPPRGGFPAVVSLNGHDGSGRAQLRSGEPYYWFGDAFARRGFVVLALDVGHRPVTDRDDLYGDRGDGDDLEAGNGPHPAIAPPGRDTDWEEDGERAWDAMRAAAFLRALPNVDRRRVSVAGLSLGGEVATWTAALDPSISFAVVAGFSPDLGVIAHHDNHPCWRWRHGDLREYIEISDLQALIAPRPLVVESGKEDRVFSTLWAPFASDKQVLRRSGVAWPPHRGPRQYLHSDGHRFRFGEIANSDGSRGIEQPLLTRPRATSHIGWQTDDHTIAPGPSLFDLLGAPAR